MAKEDETPGLLSKVVRFVRNPLTNWSELDEPELDKESKYSKQMLKEMIERKRRNDFVRRREFDHLRKLRRREALTGQDQAGRPSFFQSSMPSKPDDRAGTLKKIDEIEAQMSMQWWKTKHANDGNNAAPHGAPGAPGGFTPSNSPETDAAGLSEAHSATGRTYAPTEPASLSSEGNLMSRRPAEAQGRTEEMPAGTVEQPRPGEIDFHGADGARGPRAYDGTVSGYSSSKILGAEPSFVHDPELEEAAIRFANADYDGAEAGLMEALKREPGGRDGEEEIWMTLFDLHRSTGRQERFESAAIDYASRFGRSAPLWYSLPDLVQQDAAHGDPGGQAVPVVGVVGTQGFNWSSPEVLGVQSVAALTAALAKAAEPWRLNWTRLSFIEDAALEPFCKLFSAWCAAPVQLRFIGVERLEQLLAEATPSGDRSVNPVWWRLRMESLRITGRADEFELVALDYCVTYEVSPPSWQNARCQYLPVNEGGSDLGDFALVDDAPASEGPPSSLSSDSNGPQTVPFGMEFAGAPTAKLSGQVLGDAQEAMASLEAGVSEGNVLIVACDRLIRVDFSAAGSVLNWVAAKQADGCQVQFRSMHRLVAIFFNVIGINEHAKVLARND
jgi:anti-anti-sigma regulatory factor